MLIFEQGVGEYSIDYQSQRCSEQLSTLFKAKLERRIEQYISDVAGVSHGEVNIKGLFTIFKSKYGLAYLYRRIGVSEKAKEVLELLWQDMIFNQRHYTNASSTTLMTPPFIDNNYPKISKDFFASASFLKICSFCFLRSYELDLELMSYCEALKTLKKFIEVSWNNLQFSSRNGG
jgi:hypothetical protein